jgi:hypothetical protein
MSRLPSDVDLDSIRAAIREETAAAEENTKSAWLDTDGIEQLADAPGSFVYRLSLSSPVHFSADQTVTFHTRSSQETVQAVIMRSDDEGLVVECQKPLPTVAKLLSLSFDPSFILLALEGFVLEMASREGRIAGRVACRTTPDRDAVKRQSYPGLNEEQAGAIGEMANTALHFLWGPPGTGKTTTIGAAVAQWLRKQKRALTVSTSNATVDVGIRALLKNLRPGEERAVVRLGASLDPLVRQVTLAGKLADQNASQADTVAKAKERLRQICDLTQSRTLSHDRLQQLYGEAKTHESRVQDFNKQLASVAWAFHRRIRRADRAALSSGRTCPGSRRWRRGARLERTKATVRAESAVANRGGFRWRATLEMRLTSVPIPIAEALVVSPASAFNSLTIGEARWAQRRSSRCRVRESPCGGAKAVSH